MNLLDISTLQFSLEFYSSAVLSTETELISNAYSLMHKVRIIQNKEDLR